jgi:hypothetical protein
MSWRSGSLVGSGVPSRGLGCGSMRPGRLRAWNRRRLELTEGRARSLRRDAAAAAASGLGRRRVFHVLVLDSSDTLITSTAGERRRQALYRDTPGALTSTPAMPGPDRLPRPEHRRHIPPGQPAPIPAMMPSTIARASETGRPRFPVRTGNKSDIHTDLAPPQASGGISRRLENRAYQLCLNPDGPAGEHVATIRHSGIPTQSVWCPLVASGYIHGGLLAQFAWIDEIVSGGSK